MQVALAASIPTVHRAVHRGGGVGGGGQRCAFPHLIHLPLKADLNAHLGCHCPPHMWFAIKKSFDCS